MHAWLDLPKPALSDAVTARFAAALVRGYREGWLRKWWARHGASRPYEQVEAMVKRWDAQCRNQH